MSIEQTLVERGNRYGDFSDHAKIAQDFQKVMHNAERASPVGGHPIGFKVKGLAILNDVQRQALTVIADKIARILSGDPNYADNWHDIQGYAKLAEERLPVEERTPANDNAKSAPIVDLKRLPELPFKMLEMVAQTIEGEKLRRKADALQGHQNVDTIGSSIAGVIQVSTTDQDGFHFWNPRGVLAMPENVSHVRIRNGVVHEVASLVDIDWGVIPGDYDREIVGYKLHG